MSGQSFAAAAATKQPPTLADSQYVLRARYWRRLPNVGDAVTPLLLEALTARPAVLAGSEDTAYLLSIGSLLHTSTPLSFVWGTGLLHPDTGVGSADPSRVLAVRGKLSHAEMVRQGVAVGDVPLGDPGYLVPGVLGWPGAVEPRYALGLVAHHAERDHPFFIEASRDPDIKLLDVCDPVESFLADMADCRAIASTSLHGLVFAEGMGRPSVWLEVSDKVMGAGFKFADWFSLSTNPQLQPLRPTGFGGAAELIHRSERRPVDIDPAALIGALSKQAVQACSQATLGRTIVRVADCRKRPLPVFILGSTDGETQLRTLRWREAFDQEVDLVFCTVEANGPDRQIGADGIERLNEVVRAYFEGWAEPTRYVVMSADVDLTSVDRSALRDLNDILDRFHYADSAGPLLGQVHEGTAAEVIINSRGWRWASARVSDSGFTRVRCQFSETPFEVGFAVYRAARPITQLMRNLRVAGPVDDLPGSP